MKKLILLFILIPSVSYADEYKAADVISYATVATQLTADTIHSLKQPDKKLALEKQGLRLGITIGLSELVKHFVHEERPDGSDNKSFWSEHTAIAATSQGWNWYFGISLTTATGVGRVAAKKHHYYDVLTGAAVGTIVDFAVNKIH